MRLDLTLGLAMGLLSTAPARAQAPAPSAAAEPSAASDEPTVAPLPAPPALGVGPRYVLVEEFTAATLAPGEVKIGTDADVGLAPGWMIGTDLVALAMGATTVQTKVRLYESDAHQVSIAVRAAYLSKSTLLWGSVNEHFEELDARVVRPGIAWTNRLSPRLNLHTFWAKGFGPMRAKLSEKGRRRLWEAKHPGADYDRRDAETNTPTDPSSPEGPVDAVSTRQNQEKAAGEESSLTQQSIQVQSITGLAQERFQLTGEFVRRGGNKVLVTSRIEQTEIEQLRSKSFRLTTAHQWIWSSFQMRLGIGVQYYVVTGRDLDDEAIDSQGVLPASDIGFYWRF